MQKRFSGAVFDLDGLLIDSERVWERAQVATFLELGLDLTLEMQRATTGMRMQETIHVWRSFFPGVVLDPVGIGARLVERVGGELRAAGVAKAGAMHALDLCLKAGCRLAVASSSPPAVISAALERLKALDMFQAVISAEGELHGKPHPAVFLRAATVLGLDPVTCIAFEDSVAGVTAAKAAGMYVIAVPEAHNQGRSEYAIADIILETLESFTGAHLGV
jgi:sugar-phosphatase